MKLKISKGKITIAITAGAVSIVLMAVMFMQFKTIEETDITSIESMRESELRTSISEWKTKYEEAHTKLEETTAQIKEYTDKTQSNQETTEVLEKELSNADMLVGKTDVEGQGIIVTLSDNENKSIEAYDILQLVNELRLAGAEAISVNDVRIINMSDIVDISNSYIVINGQRLTSPYVVKAIGNQTYLESGLTQKDYGYMDKIIKGNDKTAKIEKDNKIKILKYNGDMKTKYIEE